MFCRKPLQSQEQPINFTQNNSNHVVQRRTLNPRVLGSRPRTGHVFNLRSTTLLVKKFELCFYRHFIFLSSPLTLIKDFCPSSDSIYQLMDLKSLCLVYVEVLFFSWQWTSKCNFENNILKKKGGQTLIMTWDSYSFTWETAAQFKNQLAMKTNKTKSYYMRFSHLLSDLPSRDPSETCRLCCGPCDRTACQSCAAAPPARAPWRLSHCQERVGGRAAVGGDAAEVRKGWREDN